MTHHLTSAAAALAILGGSNAAYAYRPFDSTDAAVAAYGEVELECGPVGYVVDAGDRFLVVPAAIVNLGVANRWEVVVEGRNFVRLNAPEDDRRDVLRDTALSVKGVLREGSLQGNAGPSVATEVGALLPSIGGEHGSGASVTGIVSQRWSTTTVHVNAALIVTHEHTIGTFVGTILEGPFRWPVRPVAEFNVERTDRRTVAAVAGAIWQLRDGFSFDAGWKSASTDGVRVHDVRAGFTWAFPIGSSGSARERRS